MEKSRLCAAEAACAVAEAYSLASQPGTHALYQQRSRELVVPVSNRAYSQVLEQNLQTQDYLVAGEHVTE